MSNILAPMIQNAFERGALTGRAVLELAEKEIILIAMKTNKYNQSKAATNLGVSRGTLRTKLKQYFGEEFV